LPPSRRAAPADEFRSPIPTRIRLAGRNHSEAGRGSLVSCNCLQGDSRPLPPSQNSREGVPRGIAETRGDAPASDSHDECLQKMNPQFVEGWRQVEEGNAAGHDEHKRELNPAPARRPRGRREGARRIQGCRHVTLLHPYTTLRQRPWFRYTGNASPPQVVHPDGQRSSLVLLLSQDIALSGKSRAIRANLQGVSRWKLAQCRQNGRTLA
jgi:hypothetical protein